MTGPAHGLSAADPLHYLPPNTREALDLGCNTGQTLERLLAMGVSRVHGVDINPLAIETARQRLLARPASVHHASADELPLADASVDFILCSEVLEHVAPELRSQAIAQIHRVLRPGGTLVLTVPHAGLFAGLDPANVRFRLPRLYAVVSAWVGGPARDAGYRDQKHGVVWHHHFRLAELTELLRGRFVIERVRFRGTLFIPLCDALAFPFYRKQRYGHPLLKALEKLSALDHGIDGGPILGYDVLLVAQRLDG